MAAKKGGIGRGLGSLFGMSDEEFDNNIAQSTQADKGTVNVIPEQQKPSQQQPVAAQDGVMQIDIKSIDANIEQPRKRFDETALAELCESIKLHGIIQPIIVNQMGARYMIIAGERRFRAAKLVGLETVPAIIKNYSRRQIKEVALIENLQREDLNPIEAAAAIKQLMEEHRFTQEEVATRIGKSRPSIANTLRLLELPLSVRELVQNGRLSAGHARAILSLQNPADQIKLADAACDNKMSVRDVENAVKNALAAKPKKPQPPQKPQPAELKELVSSLQRVFATKAGVIGDDKKGRLYLEYYSCDDLDRIAEILNRFS